MARRGGIWPWALAAIAMPALAGVTIGAGCGRWRIRRRHRSDQPQRRRSGAVGEAQLGTHAIKFAPELLELYQGTGDELGIDWSVLAAADQLTDSASGATDADRISAIAYELQALGAPYDYRKALEGFDAVPGFTSSVLRLADRYRELGAERAPAARLPLVFPAEGPIIAGFGLTYGVLHDGIDIDAPTGVPVKAAAAGLVVSTGFHQVFGEYTCILHRFPDEVRGQTELTTCYGNQSRYDVEPGDTVKAGEVIGRVGCTGTCLRPHVHFQVREGSGQTAPVVDPAPFLGVAAGDIGDAAPLEGDGS